MCNQSYPSAVSPQLYIAGCRNRVISRRLARYNKQGLWALGKFWKVKCVSVVLPFCRGFWHFSKKKKKSVILIFLDPSPCPPCWDADLYLLAVLVLPLVFIFVSTTKSKYKIQMYVCIPPSNLLASRTDPPGRASVCESGAQLCQYLITSTWSTNVSFERRWKNR